MDSITQAVLGASIQGALLGRWQGRRALLYGAMLGTLPDLDVIIDYGDAVADMTYHRGFSHSLFVLSALALALTLLIRKLRPDPGYSARRLFLTLWLVLITHPLLDAFTSYGTQLLWPLPLPPIMQGSLFIIDPLFTLPWLLAFGLAWWARAKPLAGRALAAGLVLGRGYLGWSLLAQQMALRAAAPVLAARGLADAPRFATPMPFNTLLWRVVAMTPDGFVEGERSLPADRGPMRFRHYPPDTTALSAVADLPVVQRLAWFNHGFQKAQLRDGALVLSDLRMGSEPDYSFNFAVARQVGADWQAIPPRQLRWSWQARGRLPAMWARIWTEPPAS